MYSKAIKKHKNRSAIWILIVIIIVILALAILAISSSQAVGISSSVNQSSTFQILPGLQTGAFPWPAEIDSLKARLKDIGLPALSAEGTVLHIHQHLDIFINGKLVPIPAGIGINQQQGFISPVHVHDNTSVIHVESPTIQTFTLGQFFDIWGVKFTNNCIGSYCTDGTNTLEVFVNGIKVSTDFRGIALEAHQEIVIAYGTDAQLPKPLPSTFDFPLGE